MSLDQRLNITTLQSFTAQLTNAVCEPRNTRFNNMAMLRALNAKSMPEILNQTLMDEAAIAYHNVLKVLIRVRLVVITEKEPEQLPLALTYDRFKAALASTKNYLLTVNS